MAPKKKNAFYMFMTEKKPEVEKRLRRKVTFSELPELLYNEWKQLPEEQKLLYKNQCTGSNNNLEKYDSRGVPLSQIQEEEEEKRMKDREMKKNIRTTVDMLKTGKAISSANFSLVHMSYYVHLENDTYKPAEIGIVQFSFAKGAFSTFHQIFPANIPVGYHFEAKSYSDSTHGLLDSITKDLDGFQDKLSKFLLKDGGKPPVLYTQNELMESVDSMLKDFNFLVPWKIYSLDTLYQHLYSASIKEIPESVATHVLQSSEFDYAPNISCQWHKNIAPNSIKYCSLSCCQRWVFNMCNSLRIQDTFGIIPKRGKHYPDFGSFQGVVDVYQTSFLSSKHSEVEEVPLVRKLKEKPTFDSAFAEDDFDAEMNNLKISESPFQKHSVKSREDSDSGRGVTVEIMKTKQVAGIPISCLGLSGFGRGKRKSKN